MDDLPLQKIAISGPTLASMLQRFSSSSGAVDGLLFGHVAHVAPSNLSDDSPSSSSSSETSSPLVATVTGFICSGGINSFYDSAGRIDSSSLGRLVGESSSGRETVIGWFSGRRRTSLRPSLREFSVSDSLSFSSGLSVLVRNAPTSATSLSPCVFVLFASPNQDQAIHTHEYRAHQYRPSSKSFDAKSVDIVNIGPEFRGHYGSFSPNSPFPLMKCDLRASPMSEDCSEESLVRLKRVSKAQKELDFVAEGLEVAQLRKLVGNQAVSYTADLEDLYEKMLLKIESLASIVEKSSTKVLEQVRVIA